MTGQVTCWPRGLPRTGILADRAIITDDVPKIIERLQSWVEDPQIDVVVTTGGTGLTGRDSTLVLDAVVEKEIGGFGELFRMLSYQKIGTRRYSRGWPVWLAAPIVRASGVDLACKDGWDDILRYQLDIRHRPCNFVEILPRLSESATVRRTG